jgi:hypothetical protein
MNPDPIPANIDRIITDFINGEHPFTIAEEANLDDRLNHAAAGIIRNTDLMAQLAAPRFQANPRIAQMRRIINDEIALYGRIKEAIGTHKHLIIAAIVGAALVALGLTMALIAVLAAPAAVPLAAYTALEIAIQLPLQIVNNFNMVSAFCLIGGTALGSTGLLCWIGTALAGVINAIRGKAEQQLINDARELQENVGAL